jgi:hypothetical protein
MAFEESSGGLAEDPNRKTVRWCVHSAERGPIDPHDQAAKRKCDLPSSIFLPSAKLARWILIDVIILYAVACSILFVAYVNPSLLGKNGLNIAADSNTYMYAARTLDRGLFTSIPSLISFQGQYLGPVMVARLLGSTVNIAVFNCAVFFLGLYFVSKLPKVALGPLFFLLIANPNTTVALLTLNKEIFAYISMILFLRYISSEDRSLILLAFALLTAMAARWEQCAVFVLFLAVDHRWSPLRDKHKTVLAAMIAAITVTWPLIAKTGIVDLASLMSTAADAQSQSLPALNALQASYGFPVVLIPKLVGNLFGIPWRILASMLHPKDLTDIQGLIVAPFQNFTMLGVFLLAFFKKKLDLRKKSIYLMWMYLIVSAAAPIFQPRYEYPIYVLLSLEISGLCSPVRATQSRPGRVQRILARLVPA